MTFWEHTDELVKRLKKALYAFIISTAIMLVFPANIPALLTNPGSFFGFYDPLIAVVLRTIKEHVLPENVMLIGVEFTSPFELYFMTSFMLGLAISAPIFAYEIFRFVDPALYPHERRDVYSFMASFLVLFISGLVFGFTIIVPYALRALLPFFSVVGAEPVIFVTNFYYTVFLLTVVTGIVFTFPVFLILLVRYGVMETKTLTTNRKYLYFAILILVFLVTPGEGGLANLMLFIPLILLLEAGIFFARRYEKKGDIRRPRWFVEEAKCRFCGKTIPQETAFCPNCGKSQK